MGIARGSSIYMSILLKTEIPRKAPMLTLVMGVSTAEGLGEYTGLDMQIKWPNDIILKGKTGRYPDGNEHRNRLCQLCCHRNRH